jgi:hypothetical protein
MGHTALLIQQSSQQNYQKQAWEADDGILTDIITKYYGTS